MESRSFCLSIGSAMVTRHASLTPAFIPRDQGLGHARQASSISDSKTILVLMKTQVLSKGYDVFFKKMFIRLS